MPFKSLPTYFSTTPIPSFKFTQLLSPNSISPSHTIATLFSSPHNHPPIQYFPYFHLLYFFSLFLVPLLFPPYPTVPPLFYFPSFSNPIPYFISIALLPSTLHTYPPIPYFPYFHLHYISSLPLILLPTHSLLTLLPLISLTSTGKN